MLDRRRSTASMGAIGLTGAVILASLAGGAATAIDDPGVAPPSQSPGPSRQLRGECWQPVALPSSVEYGRLAHIETAGDLTWVFGISSPTHREHPIALRLDEGLWVDTDVPWTGTSGLIGGDVVPGVGTWAVGFRHRGAPAGQLDLDVPMQPIAGRWVGSLWEDVGLPELPGRGATLVDVSVTPTGAVWVVGNRWQSGSSHPVVLRWDRRWHRAEPRLGPGEAGLTAVSQSPDGRVWVAGWRLRGGVTRPATRRSSRIQL
jgi:hypothetical protein